MLARALELALHSIEYKRRIEYNTLLYSIEYKSVGHFPVFDQVPVVACDVDVYVAIQCLKCRIR